MTRALALPSFKKIAAGIAGLLLSLCLFFAAAPQTQAAGLTSEQVKAVVDLMVAFDVHESAISEVTDILNKSVVNEPISAAPSVPGASTAAAPACPTLAPGAESATASNESGSCTVTIASQSVAVVPPPVPPMPPTVPTPPMPPASYTQAPDVAGLVATAAMAPWYAAVDSLSEILYVTGAADAADLVGTAAMAPWQVSVDSLSQTLFAAGVY